MKTLANVSIAALAIALVIGCEKATVEGPGGKKLTLTKPSNQTLKQGDTNAIKITINRDKFRDPVTVRFDNLPVGVDLQDKDKKIATEDSTGTFTLRAAPDADVVENHQVSVTVEGPDGMKATESFKLTVKAKG